MQQCAEFLQRAVERHVARIHVRRHVQQRLAFALRQRFQHGVQKSIVDGAEHRPHRFFADLAARIGNGLVQQGERIAHAAARAVGDQPETAFFAVDFLSLENPPQLPGDFARRQLLQVELQATRQHRHRHLLRIGGRQDEQDVRRRLFQRLQHGVEGVIGELVDFVDHVDLVAARRRRVGRAFQQVHHLVHAAIRRRVHFDVIHVAAGIDFRARAAFAAGCGGDARFAVQGLGQNARDGGLADAARAGEQVGVVQPTAGQRVSQRLDHVFLPDKGFERTRTPFAGQNLIGHAAILLQRPPRPCAVSPPGRFAYRTAHTPNSPPPVRNRHVPA